MTALNIALIVLCFVAFGLGYFAHVCKQKEPKGSYDEGVKLAQRVVEQQHLIERLNERVRRELTYFEDERKRHEKTRLMVLESDKLVKQEQERNAVLRSALLATRPHDSALRSLLFNIIDNLNDLPVNEDWAIKTVKQLEEFSK